MFNCTSTLTPDQLILLSHRASAIPALIIFYVVGLIIFLLVGLVSIDKTKGDHPYRKFFIIWVISLVLLGIFLLFLIYDPYFINKISNLFNFLSK